MIQERYCSYEVARLLKEKGFDVPCCRRYNADSMITQSTLHRTPFHQEEKTSAYVLCPTHQVACDWLEEQGIIIEVDYNNDEDCEDNERYGFTLYQNNIRKVDLATYVSRKEAIEAALKYCLTNLI